MNSNLLSREMLEIIIYAIASLIIIIRLYSVLGREEGLDHNAVGSKGKTEHDENVIEGVLVRQSSDNNDEEKKLESGLDKEVLEMFGKFKNIDPNFTIQSFLKGANIAFEFVTKEFFSGDTRQLQSLLCEPLYQKIDKKISARKNTKCNFALVAIKSSSIIANDLQKQNASITVKFISDQIINVGNDPDNACGGKIEPVEDTYVFERDLKSNDPNWSVISIYGL